jgi:AbrB family looped-hinge helix DNA binding protein
MVVSESSRIGKRGTLVIPASLRRRLGLAEGSEVIVQETDEGILIRPAMTIALELYSPERRAEFLLNNAVGEDDYAQAREEVLRLGLNPDTIPHPRP